MAKQPELLWEKAFASLKPEDKPSADPQKLDKRNFLLDLTQAIEEKRQECVNREWKLDRSDRIVSVRELFGKMVAWVNKFKEVGDVAIQYDPLHAALPWAAVRLVLVAVVNEYETNEALLEGLEYVSSLIARYAMVEALYLNQTSIAMDQLSEAIVRLYSAVLTYLARANKFYSRNTGGRFMKSAIQPVELGVDTYMKKVRTEEARVNDLARLLDADRLRQISSTMEQNFIQLNRRLRDVQLTLSTRVQTQQVSQENVLNWLDAIFTKEEYERALAARLKGTCNWVLSRPEFLSWASSIGTEDLTKILWIFGAAGFGKSVLCARLIDYLRTDLCKTVSFFFCSFADELKRQPQAILRSWVTQLVLQQDGALEVAKRAWLERQSSTATEQDLWHLFKQLATQVNDCVFVIDGYDECIVEALDFKAHPTSNSRVAFLKSLIGSTKSSKCRILLVSREDHDVRQQLANAELSSGSYKIFKLRITQDDTRDDVMAFSTSGVEQRLQNKPKSVQKDLASEAAERCEGMFLWVRLLHERLSPAKNANQLRKLLSDTPVGLNQAYERDLKAIHDFSEDQKYRAVMTLRWTLYAARPMTVQELTEALLIGLEDEESIYPANHLPDAYDDFYITELRGLCGSLLDIRISNRSSNIADQEVNFVHSSVKEYLSQSLDIHFPALQRAKVNGIAGNNGMLAQKCLRYLCYKDFKQIAQSTKESFDAKVKKYAFIRYAASQWDVHASRALPLSSEITTMSNCLHDLSGSNYRLYSEVKCSETFQTFTEALNYYDGRNWPAPLYFASYSGVIETVSYLLDQGANVDGVGGTYHTALQYAARRGNVEIFELLLRRGADPLIKGGACGSALNAAAALKEGPADTAGDMVAMLLAKGVDIEARGDDGWTPLHYAAEAGSIKIVRLLLDAGADINAATFKGWTALHIACDYDNEQTVEMLLVRGANAALMIMNDDKAVDDEDKLYRKRTALHIAVNRETLRITKILLDHGANANALDAQEWSPLHIAAELGYEPLVEELLAHNANIDATGGQNSATPSHLAAQFGHESTLRLLHEKGAYMEAVDNRGWTILHYSARFNHVNILKWLLDQKWNVDAQEKQQWTPLCAAACGGHVETVDFLLNHDADPNIQGNLTWTALMIAARDGYVEVADSLLNGDADPHIQDKEETTALYIAASRGRADIVDLLLKHDADANVQEINGWTALMIAAEDGYVDVVSLLLNRDADPNIQDKNGRTALYDAAKQGHNEIVNLLLNRGSDPSIRTNMGQTALGTAKKNGHEDVVEVLLRRAANPVSTRNKTADSRSRLSHGRVNNVPRKDDEINATRSNEAANTIPTITDMESAKSARDDRIIPDRTRYHDRKIVSTSSEATNATAPSNGGTDPARQEKPSKHRRLGRSIKDLLEDKR